MILKKDLQNLLKAEKINDEDQILLILPTAKVFPKIPVPAENSRPQKLWNLVPKVVALPYNVCTKPSQWRRFWFVLQIVKSNFGPDCVTFKENIGCAKVCKNMAKTKL